MKILAVTGCPTGVAHTFMAAEALQKEAESRNIDLKVETNGQIGRENELSPEEIAAADCIIIAADRDVEADRFNGKRVLTYSVSAGISKPDVLLQEALAGKGGIRGGEASAKPQETSRIGGNKIWNAVYKVLMNGVSYMLPFVVAGGTMIAVSLLWGIHSADPASSDYNSFAATLNNLGGLIMGMMVPVFAAYMAEAIGKRPALTAGFAGGLVAVATGAGFIGGVIAGAVGGFAVVGLTKVFKKLPKSLDGLTAMFFLPFFGSLITGLVMYGIGVPVKAINTGMTSFLSSFQGSSPIILGIIVGCMIAFDLGGPVNKAAFVTGVALLGEGNMVFMAGVSAAVMVPPLMTSVATILYRKYYDETDRNAGLVNLLLGGTHISEGSIPFAAKDPFRIIPLMMVSSSVAASLSYLFQCTSPAPHGGFLVLPVIGNPVPWAFSIIAASVLGGTALGYLKKTQTIKARGRAQEGTSRKLSA